jgi:hypothetical protein
MLTALFVVAGVALTVLRPERTGSASDLMDSVDRGSTPFVAVLRLMNLRDQASPAWPRWKRAILPCRLIS